MSVAAGGGVLTFDVDIGGKIRPTVGRCQGFGKQSNLAILNPFKGAWISSFDTFAYLRFLGTVQNSKPVA